MPWQGNAEGRHRAISYLGDDLRMFIDFVPTGRRIGESLRYTGASSVFWVSIYEFLFTCLDLSTTPHTKLH
jgi:hypothetical protein